MTVTPKRRTRTRFPGVYRSSSGRYEISYRDSTGRLVFETVADTLEDAKAIRADRVSGMRLRGQKIVTRQPSFRDYADKVVRSLVAPDSTKAKHRYHLEHHLKPRFGRLPVGRVDVDDVAKLVTAMQQPRPGRSGKPKAPLRPATVVGTLATLSLIMGKAVRAGYAPVNPVRQLDRSERPSIPSGRKRALSGGEIERLLAEAGDTFRPIVATMIFTGLRIGEVLGLRWQDIDRDAGMVRVRGQLTRKREFVSYGKTRAAVRDIVLIPELDTILLEYRLASRYSQDADFVFTASDGQPRGHRTTSRGIERAVTRAKLDGHVSAHVFRHTFASHLIVGMKEDAVTVASMMGHEKPSFTQDVYAHMFEAAKDHEERRRRYSEGFGKHLRAISVSGA
jgi:integrase